MNKKCSQWSFVNIQNAKVSASSLADTLGGRFEVAIHAPIGREGAFYGIDGAGLLFLLRESAPSSGDTKVLVK